MALPEVVEGFDEEETSIPVILDHCVVVYQAMFELAQVRNTEDGGELLVYEGHLTHLLTSLNFSTPFYTNITRELKRMGCVRQLRRGGGNTASQWQLIQEPTPDTYRAAPKATYTQNIGKREAQMRALETSIRDAYKRMDAQDKALEFMLKILESYGMNQIKPQEEKV